uniref:Isochorismatase family protein n=1 Tax=Fervidobacterium thailandense TaxID=1008305 RepID=A0A7C5VP47_9BACT
MFYLERERHPLGIELCAGNVGLIIVDVQRYFFDPQSPAYLKGVERVFGNIRRLIEIAKHANVPVIATVHAGGNENMRRWWKNTVDTPWTELAVDRDTVDHVLMKDSYDAFHQTELEDLLRFYQISTILVAGVMTHLCCETTARSAFVRGYNVIMVEDCLWDKDEWYHYASLRSLAHGFAIISNLNEVEQLLEECKNS